jgi:hypothetical protein
MRGDDRQATGGAARHVAEQGQARCRRVVEDSRVCVWDTATEISWISWQCATPGVAPGSDAQRISTRRRAVNDISIMLSLEERDRLARSTRVPAPSCQGEPFTFLCPVITRATLGLGSFHVRERGCPGRLLRPTSLWVSEFHGCLNSSRYPLELDRCRTGKDKLEKTCTAAPGRSPTRCPVKSAAPIAGPGAPSEARSNVLSASR